MTPEPSVERFALRRFAALDVDRDAEELSALLLQLEQLALSRLAAAEGYAGLEALVGELASVGHRLERRETQPGWVSWFQETHGGERHFWVHAERDGDDCSVMVLYDETLGVTVARRRAGMQPERRADDERTASFYDRGLALTERGDDAALGDDEARLLRLYRLETGVANGGLATWLTNTDGLDLDEVVRDLREIGAVVWAGILGLVAARLHRDGDGLTDAARDALETDTGWLEELDARLDTTDESLARLTLDHLESRGA